VTRHMDTNAHLMWFTNALTNAHLMWLDLRNTLDVICTCTIDVTRHMDTNAHLMWLTNAHLMWLDLRNALNVICTCTLDVTRHMDTNAHLMWLDFRNAGIQPGGQIFPYCICVNPVSGSYSIIMYAYTTVLRPVKDVSNFTNAQWMWPEQFAGARSLNNNHNI